MNKTTFIHITKKSFEICKSCGVVGKAFDCKENDSGSNLASSYVNMFHFRLIMNNKKLILKYNTKLLKKITLNYGILIRVVS